MKDFKNVNTILWDWNGTLLNDMHICIAVINMLLTKRKKPVINAEQYKRIFTFPVKEYYIKAGFDFNQESFEKPATEFIEQYYVRMHEAKLHQEVNEILEYFKEKKFRQIIISAMKQDALLESVRGSMLENYFTCIAGINDHYAHSKVESALKVMKSQQLKKKQTCLIGDTLHDFEVASALDIPCILVADGHQSRNRLEKLDCMVVDKLTGIKKVFNKY